MLSRGLRQIRRTKLPDEADMADRQCEQNLAASLAYRKPISLICEEPGCGQPSQRFQNGAIGRWCAECNTEFWGGE